jgi:hypothetical protein
MDRGKVMLRQVVVLGADAELQQLHPAHHSSHLTEGLVGRHILLVPGREVLERHQQLLMEPMEALYQPVQYHHL